MFKDENFKEGEIITSEIYGNGIIMEHTEHYVIIQWKFLQPMKFFQREYGQLKVKRFYTKNTNNSNQ